MKYFVLFNIITIQILSYTVGKNAVQAGLIQHIKILKKKQIIIEGLQSHNATGMIFQASENKNDTSRARDPNKLVSKSYKKQKEITTPTNKLNANNPSKKHFNWKIFEGFSTSNGKTKMNSKALKLLQKFERKIDSSIHNNKSKGIEKQNTKKPGEKLHIKRQRKVRQNVHHSKTEVGHARRAHVLDFSTQKPSTKMLQTEALPITITQTSTTHEMDDENHLEGTVLQAFVSSSLWTTESLLRNVTEKEKLQYTPKSGRYVHTSTNAISEVTTDNSLLSDNSSTKIKAEQTQNRSKSGISTPTSAADKLEPNNTSKITTDMIISASTEIWKHDRQDSDKSVSTLVGASISDDHTLATSDVEENTTQSPRDVQVGGGMPNQATSEVNTSIDKRRESLFKKSGIETSASRKEDIQAVSESTAISTDITEVAEIPRRNTLFDEDESVELLDPESSAGNIVPEGIDNETESLKPSFYKRIVSESPNDSNVIYAEGVDVSWAEDATTAATRSPNRATSVNDYLNTTQISNVTRRTIDEDITSWHLSLPEDMAKVNHLDAARDLISESSDAKIYTDQTSTQNSLSEIINILNKRKAQKMPVYSFKVNEAATTESNAAYFFLKREIETKSESEDSTGSYVKTENNVIDVPSGNVAESDIEPVAYTNITEIVDEERNKRYIRIEQGTLNETKTEIEQTVKLILAENMMGSNNESYLYFNVSSTDVKIAFPLLYNLSYSASDIEKKLVEMGILKNFSSFREAEKRDLLRLASRELINLCSNHIVEIATAAGLIIFVIIVLTLWVCYRKKRIPDIEKESSYELLQPRGKSKRKKSSSSSTDPEERPAPPTSRKKTRKSVRAVDKMMNLGEKLKGKDFEKRRLLSSSSSSDELDTKTDCRKEEVMKEPETKRSVRKRQSDKREDAETAKISTDSFDTKDEDAAEKILKEKAADKLADTSSEYVKGRKTPGKSAGIFTPETVAKKDKESRDRKKAKKDKKRKIPFKKVGGVASSEELEDEEEYPESKEEIPSEMKEKERKHLKKLKFRGKKKKMPKDSEIGEQAAVSPVRRLSRWVQGVLGHEKPESSDEESDEDSEVRKGGRVGSSEELMEEEEYVDLKKKIPSEMREEERKRLKKLKFKSKKKKRPKDEQAALSPVRKLNRWVQGVLKPGRPELSDEETDEDSDRPEISTTLTRSSEETDKTFTSKRDRVLKFFSPSRRERERAFKKKKKEEKKVAPPVRIIISESDYFPEVAVPPTSKIEELKTRLVTGGDSKKIDDMLVRGDWERSFFTAHDIGTIGEEGVDLLVHVPDERRKIDAARIVGSQAQSLGVLSKESSEVSLRDVTWRSLHDAEGTAISPKAATEYELKRQSQKSFYKTF